MDTFVLRLHHGALVMLAPPCSLMGPACAAIHGRNYQNPCGNQDVYKVRLSQRIWRNSMCYGELPFCSQPGHVSRCVVIFVAIAHAEATFVRLISQLRPRLCYCFEQPSQSWGYKQPFMVQLLRDLGMPLVMQVFSLGRSR